MPEVQKTAVKSPAASAAKKSTKAEEHKRKTPWNAVGKTPITESVNGHSYSLPPVDLKPVVPDVAESIEVDTYVLGKSEDINSSTPETPSKSPAVKRLKAMETVTLEDLMKTMQAMNSAMEGRLGSMESRLESRLGSMESRMGSLENKFDARLDTIEQHMKANSAQIAGLAQSVQDNVKEIQKVKDSLALVEGKVSQLAKDNAALKAKVAEADRLGRRNGLRISGLKEDNGEDVQLKVIELFSTVLPTLQTKQPDSINTVYRIGRQNNSATRPRQVIVQFALRSHRDAIWKATKSNSFVKAQGIRFAEDLSAEDRETRSRLWPQIEKARREGKSAYFKGPDAYIEGHKVALDSS